MTRLSNILLDKEILLESGTNELEVLVFNVAGFTFGINVAKVREVLPAMEITALPKAHPSIRGVFKLRNQVIPCVSLLDHLGICSEAENPESTMILTDLNQQQTAFLADNVERIHRLSWENILAVPSLDALANTPVTALARCQQRLIVMLDFEMILDDVTDQYFRTDEVANPMGLPREKLRILLAEDSPTVRQAIRSTLTASGYTQLTFFENGAEAWSWIEHRLAETGRLEDVGDLLICDVEMPQVDGFHLTKKIKEHTQLKPLPVLLYSSIITPDNQKKGNAVGADAQVAKPELSRVVELADELISNSRRESRANALQEITQAAEHRARDNQPQSQTVAVAQPDRPDTSSEPLSSVAGPIVDQCEPEPPTGPATELSSTSLPDRVAVDPPVVAPPAPAPPADPLAECPPPEGVNAGLWQTFHHELEERASHLHTLLDQGQAEAVDDALFREVARTLHTIKSAAMVVPIDQVTRATHLVESLMEPAREDPSRWPGQSLNRYLGWLDQLIAADGDVEAALRDAEALEAELNRHLVPPAPCR